MGIRRQGRILAFQALYSWEMNKQPDEIPTDFDWLTEKEKSKYPGESMQFASFLIKGTVEAQKEIDSMICDKLVHWDFSRLSKVDLSILRLSVFSLIHQRDIPMTVTIDEAVDIAKKYGAEDSYRFINGVLDNIAKMIERGEDE